MRNIRQPVFMSILLVFMGFCIFQYSFAIWNYYGTADPETAMGVAQRIERFPDQMGMDATKPNGNLVSAGFIGPFSEPVSMLLLGIFLMRLGGLGRDFLKKKN